MLCACVLSVCFFRFIPVLCFFTDLASKTLHEAQTLTHKQTQTRAHPHAQIQFESKREYVKDCACICCTLRARARAATKMHRTQEGKTRFGIELRKFAGENVSFVVLKRERECRRHILDFVEKAFSDVNIHAKQTTKRITSITNTSTQYMCKQRYRVSCTYEHKHKHTPSKMESEIWTESERKRL